MRLDYKTATVSRAARLAILALINRRGQLGEVKALSRALGVDSGTLSGDLREVPEVSRLLEEMIKSFGLSPSVDTQAYSTSEVAAEFGITTLAVTGLAKRRGVGTKLPGQGHHWTFTRADVEAMRVRGKGGRPRQTHQSSPPLTEI